MPPSIAHQVIIAHHSPQPHCFAGTAPTVHQKPKVPTCAPTATFLGMIRQRDTKWKTLARSVLPAHSPPIPYTVNLAQLATFVWVVPQLLARLTLQPREDTYAPLVTIAPLAAAAPQHAPLARITMAPVEEPLMLARIAKAVTTNPTMLNRRVFVVVNLPHPHLGPLVAIALADTEASSRAMGLADAFLGMYFIPKANASARMTALLAANLRFTPDAILTPIGPARAIASRPTALKFAAFVPMDWVLSILKLVFASATSSKRTKKPAMRPASRRAPPSRSMQAATPSCIMTQRLVSARALTWTHLVSSAPAIALPVHPLATSK